MPTCVPVSSSDLSLSEYSRLESDDTVSEMDSPKRESSGHIARSRDSSRVDKSKKSAGAESDIAGPSKSRDHSKVRAKPSGSEMRIPHRSESRPSRKRSVSRHTGRHVSEVRMSAPGASVAPGHPVSGASVAPSTRDIIESECELDESEEEVDSDKYGDEITGRDVRRLIKTMALSMKDQSMSKLTDSTNGEIQFIVAYRDTDEIHHYIMGLEADLKDLRIPEKRWKRILLRKLTPKARKAVRGFVSEFDCSYSELKSALIKKLGLSRSAVTDKLFGTSERELKQMDHVCRYQHLRDHMERLVLSCKSVNETCCCSWSVS